MLDKERPYNERLFSKGIRSKIHYSRFHWLQSSLRKLNCVPKSVIELGCYDAKTIHFLPTKPDRYVGLDANFEGGLDLAKSIWNDQNFRFYECSTPNEINIDESFEISICMETFELISPDLLEAYVEKLARLTSKYIFVTTSNQKGLGFGAKHLVKLLLGYDVPKYTINEFFQAVIGNMHMIKRNNRKGWDYNVIKLILSKYFNIIQMSKYPFRILPGFGVCFIGEKKQY